MSRLSTKWTSWTAPIHRRLIHVHYKQLLPFKKSRAIGSKEASGLNCQITRHLGWSDTTFRQHSQEWGNRGRKEHQENRRSKERDDRPLKFLDASLSMIRDVTGKAEIAIITDMRFSKRGMNSWKSLLRLPSSLQTTIHRIRDRISRTLQIES
ncbi:hypothetical protein TNCV_3562681 [Trichonephila clavipes]|nr:hypothetical protein TNCV_3562681 [Trichonephila clavipes]